MSFKLANVPGKIILAGDLNCALDPKLDRSSRTDTSHSQTRKKIHQYMNDLNICDPWQMQNPCKGELSCYSTVFKNHSRIDYFLISASLLPNITNSTYDSIVLSDHAPTSLFYKTELVHRRSTTCRLHPKWLHDSGFIKFIGDHIALYFSINTSQTTAAIRWDAFKAYIREQMISFTSAKVNKFKQTMSELDNKMKELEREVIVDDSPEKKQELMTIKAKYEELSLLKGHL